FDGAKDRRELGDVVGGVAEVLRELASPLRVEEDHAEAGRTRVPFAGSVGVREGLVALGRRRVALERRLGRLLRAVLLLHGGGLTEVFVAPHRTLERLEVAVAREISLPVALFVANLDAPAVAREGAVLAASRPHVLAPQLHSAKRHRGGIAGIRACKSAHRLDAAEGLGLTCAGEEDRRPYRIGHRPRRRDRGRSVFPPRRARRPPERSAPPRPGGDLGPRPRRPRRREALAPLREDRQRARARRGP